MSDGVVMLTKEADALLTSYSLWAGGGCISLVGLLFTEWSTWVLIQEATVAMMAVVAMTLVALFQEKHGSWGTGAAWRCVHFAIVGAGIKYRHTCWSIGVFFSAAAAVVLALFRCWMGCLVVIGRAMLLEQTRRAKIEPSYIPFFSEKIDTSSSCAE